MFSILGLATNIPNLSVAGNFYLTSARKFNFSLASEDFRKAGETQFAFLVPEPAAEDIDLLRKLIKKEVISQRLAATILMVDFPNPIFSPSRKQLLKYIPSQLTAGEKGKDLDKKFVQAVKASNESNTQESPEKEFLAYWSIPEDQWIQFFQQHIEAYFQVLQQKLQTQEGFDDIVKLAESRRFSFKQLPLFEFPLTFSTTNISADQFPLSIKADGKVS
jgi:hypothetical protein